MCSTWIIVAGDGRHVSMGRLAPPDAHEIACAAAALQAQGILFAWVARFDGDYYGRKRPSLQLRCAIVGAPDAAAWAAADAAWHRARAAAFEACAPPSISCASAAA